MKKLRVLHLVDDTTAGGVMRLLDYILTSEDMAETTSHSLKCVNRGCVSLARFEADVIVSHLAISWRAIPMLLALRARHPKTPLIHVEHSYTEAFVALNVIHKRRFATLLRSAYRLFDHVVAVSEAQALWLSQSGAVRADKLRVIQSCVDLSAFRNLGPAQWPVRTIGAIGRLDRQKGFDTLISAFRTVHASDVALLIFGEGNEEDALRRLAAGDPRIRFMGFSTDPVAAIAAVDVVAMPSHWEAYGLVAIEALAAGRGLIVNPIDGLNDHIAYGARATRDTSVQAWQEAIESQLKPDFRPLASSLSSDLAFEQRFFNGWTSLLSNLLPK